LKEIRVSDPKFVLFPYSLFRVPEVAATKFNGVVFIERRYELVMHREHFNLFSKCAATIECASLVNDFS
jgi:hypothetical protein